MSVMAFCLVTVYGCGTSGSSSSGSGSAKPSVPDNSTRYDYIHETKYESTGKYDPVNPSNLSLSKIQERPPFDYAAFSIADAERLRRGYEHLAIAYQQSPARDLPP